ncbi:MAG: NAD(P)H-hydrate epimerase [Candidatus Omnitrophota bacterium]|nr:NAD(P)H-hydrate epimerase [Candidatus Omnitrophota bacterium]
MARAVSGAQMMALDKKAIKEYKIPSLLLMENAGRGISDYVSRELAPGSRILILCGKGNNGGDGLVAARHLWNRGYKAEILLVGVAKNLKPDAAVNWKIATRMKIPASVFSPKQTASTEKRIAMADLVLDALFGVGLSREVKEPHASLIKLVNRVACRVVAVDIPSGLHADSGRVLGTAIFASSTLTLGLHKKGLHRGEGPRYAGLVHVLDISIPRELLRSRDPS